MTNTPTRQTLPLPRTNLTSDERLDQFFDILFQSDKPLTVGQVARRAGMVKTYRIQQLLQELVEGGDAIAIERHHGRRLPTMYFAYLDQQEGAEDYQKQVLAAASACGLWRVVFDEVRMVWHNGDYQEGMQELNEFEDNQQNLPF